MTEKRVLIVEDEILIGADLGLMLEDWGYRADGPHATVSAALAAIEANPPDIALLDVNLGRDETSFDAARALRDRDIPYVFLTGYSLERYVDEDVIQNAPCLKKPVAEGSLRRMLAEFAT